MGTNNKNQRMRKGYLRRFSAEMINTGRCFDPNKTALYDCFSKTLTKATVDVPVTIGLQRRLIDPIPPPVKGLIEAKHRHWAMESIKPVIESGLYVQLERTEIHTLRLYFIQNRFAFVKEYSTLRLESYEYSSREAAYRAHKNGNISWGASIQLNKTPP